MQEPGQLPGIQQVVRHWSSALSNTNGVTLSAEQLEQILLGLLEEMPLNHHPATNSEKTQPDEGSFNHQAAKRFRTLFAQAPLGIALADAEGMILESNPALDDLLGYATGELLGHPIANLGSGERDRTTLRSGLAELAETTLERYQQPVLLAHAHDVPVWADVTLTELPGDDFADTYLVLMAQDTNEIHLLQETLRHQNVHDPLTGLPNISRFKTKLQSLLEVSTGAQTALIYFDIDGFKVINDGLGAGVGDKVLRGIARKLTSMVADHQGFVARVSGDGFAVVLQGDLVPASVIALTEEIFREFAEPMHLDGHDIGISASAGIVVRETSAASASDLLRAGEITLHRAKEAGKAQWVLFNTDLDRYDRSRYQLGAAMAGALANGEFSLIYQPTVKLANPRQLAAVNAGLRWQHPTLGELDSDEFYPLAETTGMTIPLGRWLLTESLAATARWRAKFGESAPDVCVRLPKRLAIDPDLVLLVKEQLDRYHLPANALRLCTDSASILDPRGEVPESLSVLADLGAQLVLAISNSADIELIPQRQLPVKHVILSGLVVDAIADGEDEASIRHLTQLIERARELKLRIGAEGVRNHRQAARLLKLGVIAARGAFVTESASGDEVDQLIDRHAE